MVLSIADAAAAPMNVTIIGNGAISRSLQSYLAADARFSQPRILPHRLPDSAAQTEFVTLLNESDVVVEAAGIHAVRTYGPQTILAGKDFLISSVGALADAELRSLLTVGPGRYFPTTGAIGGLDLLTAAAALNGIDRVALRTSKLPEALVQDWMSAEQQADIRRATVASCVFFGSPEAAITKFPASLNVAIALRLAVGASTQLTVELMADPSATLTEHLISAAGPAGEYEFRIRNQPDPQQPKSSGLTAQSLYSGLTRLAQSTGRFI